jgi:hypothetical protein
MSWLYRYYYRWVFFANRYILHLCSNSVRKKVAVAEEKKKQAAAPKQM